MMNNHPVGFDMTLGTPLSWPRIVEHLQYIKAHGIDQFIALYHRVRGRERDQLRWGDEIKYTIVKFDDEHKKVRVSLRAKDLLDALMASEDVNRSLGEENRSLWRPEFAAYMVEGTPGTPYGGLMSCFNIVEYNMRLRYDDVSALLRPNESLLSISFPALGAPNFTDPPAVPRPTHPDSVGRSVFYPDEAIYSGHPRFHNLVRNIRGRRCEKVAINVPVFRDKNTPSPFIETFEDAEASRAALPDHIYMDHMGFGMGLCCLQMTFHAVNEMEARWLYDQLTSITPIMVALSAATPIFRSYLSDVDSRWPIISASVDDRTPFERGLVSSASDGYSKFNAIPKSRYDSTDCYIYPCSAQYNDIQLQYDEQLYQRLIAGSVDEHLARHIAHMFIRDPLQVFEERIKQDDQKSTEHFETIQSSNWMNMRFKPPPPDDPNIGWRVEFRPTEVQLTHFENAAYCCFLVLLTRMIVSNRLTFLIPISLVTENMQRAVRRDAISTQKLYFRKTLAYLHTPEGKPCPEGRPPAEPEPYGNNVAEISIDEIVNGNTDFPGLVPLMLQFLNSADVNAYTRCTINQYLSFIQKRARGEIWTTAKWMREFVHQHQTYEKDSHVPDECIYDMMKKMDSISRGEHCEKLLGDFKKKTEQTELTRLLLSINPKRWICNDIMYDLFRLLDRPQLGLKLALFSPRFNALVNKHFNGKAELTIWRTITICKDNGRSKPELLVHGKSEGFPLPDHLLHNKIRFNDLQIWYIDDSVITFLRANQQIWNRSGTKLELDIEENPQIWDAFSREIWPIFEQNIRHLSFSNGHYLDNLRRHTSPTVLTDFNIISIRSENLLPDSIADDGPNATAGQALSKWLNTPTKDGQPKQLSCYDLSESPNIHWIINFKKVFFDANTSSASYIIRIGFFESTEIEPFEFINERTNEMLTFTAEEDNRWVLKRCQIGETIQWEDKISDNLNNIKFELYDDCIGPLSSPKAGQNNAKDPLEMNAGPSEEQKKK
ncbi:hypothetical protein niasHT_010053 [Heterodera trifolii]|uniref:glutamate--cysteine ligase n=1 Tax=Heterodera trifolii TaxID=157864 RepID=A0ABD2LYJ2_9BILA